VRAMRDSRRACASRQTVTALTTGQAVLFKVRANGTKRSLPYLVPGREARVQADLDDWAGAGYDGELEAGMTLSVESYVGPVGGREGVKLEQQVSLTPSCAEPISSYPCDTALTG
jgi:hypothetical protein